MRIAYYTISQLFQFIFPGEKSIHELKTMYRTDTNVFSTMLTFRRLTKKCYSCMKSSHSITSSIQRKASSLQIFVNINLVKACKKISVKQSRSLIWSQCIVVNGGIHFTNKVEVLELNTNFRNENALWKLLNLNCASFHSAVNVQRKPLELQ